MADKDKKTLVLAILNDGARDSLQEAFKPLQRLEQLGEQGELENIHLARLNLNPGEVFQSVTYAAEVSSSRYGELDYYLSQQGFEVIREGYELGLRTITLDIGNNFRVNLEVTCNKKP